MSQHQDLDVLVEGALVSESDQFDRPTEDQEEEREHHRETIVRELVRPRG